MNTQISESPKNQTVLWCSSSCFFCFSLCIINLMCPCSSNEGIWSNEGCVRFEGNMTYSVCLCNHLTNFAILMQVVPLKVGVLAAFSRQSCSQQPLVFSSLTVDQKSAKQRWHCFARACKNSVNNQRVRTASTYSFKNKHLCKCAYFAPAAAYYCPFLYALQDCGAFFFFCAENCTTALTAPQDGL